MSDHLHHSEGSPERIKVLIYHRVSDSEKLCAELGSLCVHVGRFRRQLSILDRWGFTPITFRDYQLFRAGKLNLPKKPIIITFDDGYQDVYEFAYPLLREFGMSAVVFALADPKIRTNTWDHTRGISDAPLMVDRQLVELHEAGIEIGSHGMAHRALPYIPKEEAREEISRSRMLLEILLNSPVLSFAYPYGLANEAVKKMVQEAGYLTGCGVYTGPGTFGVDDFDVRRILIPASTGTAGFCLRVFAPYQHYASLKWNFKSLLGMAPKGGEEPASAYDGEQISAERKPS
jgi:peptidoglycan/xylan/chitin deacetylase (PgdA/CDA1 family)